MDTTTLLIIILVITSSAVADGMGAAVGFKGAMA
jgi:hypothetical protein